MANAIVGVGEPTPSWRDERSTLALVVDAVRLALDDAGIAASEVDGFTSEAQTHGGPMNASIPEFEPFHDGVARGELRLPRCERCGRFGWYPLPGLPHGCGGAIAWTTVRPVGTVYASTTVRRPFLPGATPDDVPIATGLVELDDVPGVGLVVRFAEDLAVPADTRVAGRFGTDRDRPDLRFAPDPGANEDSGAPSRTASCHPDHPETKGELP